MKTIKTYESFLSNLFKKKPASKVKEINESEIEFLRSLKSQIKPIFSDLISNRNLNYESQILMDSPVYIEISIFPKSETERLNLSEFIESLKRLEELLETKESKVYRYTTYIYGNYDRYRDVEDDEDVEEFPRVGGVNWMGETFDKSVKDLKHLCKNYPESSKNVRGMSIRIIRK